jgi:hypothetical protein
VTSSHPLAVAPRFFYTTTDNIKKRKPTKQTTNNENPIFLHTTMVILSSNQPWDRYEPSTPGTKPSKLANKSSLVASSTTNQQEEPTAAASSTDTTMADEHGALLIVPFGGSAPPATTLDKTILGGKGAGLQSMGAIGIEVPPGFTLTTEVCGMFRNDNHQDGGAGGGLPDHVWQGVLANIQRVEQDMGGRKFGDTEQMPLLLSCRSGAAVSMPGMMDTVLNVGLNADTVQALARATNNPKFAYDSFRRLLDMLGDVVSQSSRKAMVLRRSNNRLTIHILSCRNRCWEFPMRPLKRSSTTSKRAWG